MASPPLSPHATIVLLVGTRPEIIKLWPVARALEQRGTDFEVWFSGQHPDLGPQAFAALGMSPAKSLAIVGTDTMHDFVGRAVACIAEELRREPPAMVLVQGDTATAYAGAQAAFLGGVPLAHVEAGLRTHDVRNPFPEEFFRTVITRGADLHFAPTTDAADNLRREGIDASSVMVTGNTVVDALEEMKRSPQLFGARPTAVGDADFALLTVHRRESFGAPMLRIGAALRRVLREHPRLHLVFPGHPNPGTLPLREALADHDRVHLVAPLGYPEFLGALGACRLAISDSGGVQEEAPSFAKPVVVLREVTERPEGIRAGFSYLAGTDVERIASTVGHLLTTEEQPWRHRPNPYGDGRAAERIADALRPRSSSPPLARP